MRKTSLKNVIPWTIIVLIVAFGYLQNVQLNEKLQVQADCTTQFLSEGFDVLNGRAAYSPELNKASKESKQAEAALFGFLVKLQATPPPPSAGDTDRFNELVREYFRSIQAYLTALGQTDSNQQENPIPTPSDYQACLQGG